MDASELLREYKNGRRDFSGADLRGAFLKGVDLPGADLSGADLSGACLSGANLAGAFLWGANLRGAYLRGAFLKAAILENANLEEAVLGDVNLERAITKGANFKNTNLDGANLSKMTAPASHAHKFGICGLVVGFIAMRGLPPGGGVFAAGIFGAMCGGGGYALGLAVGNFIDDIRKGVTVDERFLPSSNISVVSLALGIAGLVAWFIPLVGLPTGIAGYFTAQKGKFTRERKMALTGMGLSVLCLWLSAVNFYFGFHAAFPT